MKHHNRSHLLSGCSGCLLLVDAITPHASAPPYKYLAIFEGKCEEVAINNIRLDGLCGHAVINALYANGRTAFSFILSNKAAVSFSGDRDSHPAPDRYVLLVNRVEVIAGEKQMQLAGAAGACQVEGNVAKSVDITCEAGATARGSFRIRLQTIRAPDVIYGK